ncbi:hypothetical protein MMC15_008495 [Xylographa vitiligo]|nr:hypothetical protein [Xylographa vitiligo]
MITNFYMDGNTVGCDFCGITESAGPASTIPVGVRVIGADFPYRPNNPYNGAFAQYAVCDSRQTLKAPEEWSDIQAAALGAIGWGTACMAISDPEALNLQGRPSTPVEKPIPVLVYGGATATGCVAIQMLKQSGYAPIAVCSSKSAPQVMKWGAIGTASYTSGACVDTIKSLAGGMPIKHALDCITDPESVAVCFGALSRVGGRYACLEDCPDSWRTRRSVKVKVVMGFESKGVDVDLGHPVYTRKKNPELHAIGSQWTKDIQSLLDQGLLTTQPVREVDGQFEGIIKALEMLQSGEVKGEKLAVKVSSS